MRAFARDFRYALRQLRANPAFTALAIVSLAIGIGAPTTIFTLANAALFRPLPLRDADRLVYAYETSGGTGFHSFSLPQYKDLASRTRTLTGMTAFDQVPLSVTTTGEPTLTLGQIVTGNFFQVLGTTPELGRFFAADEDGPGTRRAVAVVSDAFWRKRLGADPSAVGTTIQVNGQAFTVIGVTRPEFAEVSALIKPEVWTTMGTASVTRPDARIDRRGYQTFEIAGRLAAGVSRETAEHELEGIARQIMAEHPAEAKLQRSVDLFPFTSLPTEARRGIGIFMALLMGFGALILFVACGNVASMLLARGITRRRELAIRTALGAARHQLVAQLLTETVMLFVAGAAAATGLAYAASRAIIGFKPPIDVPITLEIPLDWRVFGFALGVAVVVGTVFGLLPGLRSTRGGPSSVLKEESGTVSGRSRARAAVVVGQLAFTFMLLVGAGLVIRALSGALHLDPGFDRNNVQVASTDLQMGGRDPSQSTSIALAWRDAVAATPGVTGAALVSRAPLGAGNSTNSFKIVGGDAKYSTEFISADWAAVSPEYFPTLGIRIVAGRNFTSSDAKGSATVAIVSDAFAKRYYGSALQAVGRTLQTGDAATDIETIVGVAADTKVRSLAEEPRPMMYDAAAQGRIRKITMLVRSSRPDISSVIRGELHRLNPAVPMVSSMTYEQYVGIALLPQRVAAVVSGILGIAGLLLATLGVYGIVAYSVSQRTREIGIRMAVGATPTNVVSTMARAGLELVAAGVGVGLVLSLAGTRVLSSFLLGVSPTDPLIFGAITFGLGSIAFVACAVPARRAARVDPLAALRSD